MSTEPPSSSLPQNPAVATESSEATESMTGGMENDGFITETPPCDDSEDTQTASEARRPGSSVDGDASEETVSEDFSERWTDSWDAQSTGYYTRGSHSRGSEDSKAGGGRRLTARQLARQERLQQGVQQTKWSDLNLPPELDYSTKAKPKYELSEEQQLKRSKEAERRRLQMQKQRKENEESTKARIRAATSARFRDAISKTQADENRNARENHEPLEPGLVKIRRRVGDTRVILPEGAELPSGLQPKRFCGYPQPRHDVEIELLDSVRAAVQDLHVGVALKLVLDEKTSEVWCETEDGIRVGIVPHMETALDAKRTALVRSVRYQSDTHLRAPHALTLRL